MRRTIIALLGLAVLGALFAGVYYTPENKTKVEDVPAFHPGPGEVRTFGIQPSVPGSVILIQVEVYEGEVDLYLLEKEWASSLVSQRDGTLSLARPFSFLADHSATHVNGPFETALVSDGETWHVLVVDNSDNHYDGDAVPTNGSASVGITSRYVAEETRSLVLGYIAATPSVLLVVATMWRQGRRWRLDRAKAP